MEMTVRIEPMLPEDWPAVVRIYEEGIAGGMATFETTIPSWEAWNGAHRADCRLAARIAGEVVGWAALSPVSARAAYAGVAEVSIYVAQAARGRGVGKALLAAMVDASELAGVWTLQAVIFAQNLPSIALFRACGFREVGRREKIARRGGVWHDTILMERRSPLF